jgi:hypothetical protein
MQNSKKYPLKFLYVRKKFILGHIDEQLIKNGTDSHEQVPPN